jgi:hypothetical protein
MTPEAHALFRRQLLFAIVGGALVITALVLVVAVAQAGIAGPVRYVPVRQGGSVHMHAQSPNATFVLWGAGVGLLVVAGVLAVVVGHAVRVATFAFRREVA